MIVPSRSGSAITASADEASISSRRPGDRVVPRTVCPCAASADARARPRQPQPTMRTRATSGVRRWRRPGFLSPDAAAQLFAPALVLGHLSADVFLGPLATAAFAAAGVL